MPTRWIAGALLFCAWALSGYASAPGSELSLSEYLSELHRLSAAVENLQNDPPAASELARSLPASWTVRADGQTFRINTDGLLTELEVFQKSPRDTVQRLRERIEALQADAEAFAQPPADLSAYRARLEKILARPEFRDVQGPTWWDRLKQKIVRLLARLVERVFGSSVFPTLSKTAVWTLIVAAVIAVAWWTYKVMKRNARIETILPRPVPIPLKPWSVWMDEAHSAAAEARWRDAIHSAYWSGVSFLEDEGMWRPDRARTPREYLSLLPSASEYGTALFSLTRQFEAVWYGYKPAGPESFKETVSYLDALGCHSN
jgi:hypothetical protein